MLITNMTYETEYDDRSSKSDQHFLIHFYLRVWYGRVWCYSMDGIFAASSCLSSVGLAGTFPPRYVSDFVHFLLLLLLLLPRP